MPKVKRLFCEKAASVLFAVFVFLLILSFSISLPIYCRPFYYAHIDALELEAFSGFSKDEIKTAFNGTVDYLTHLSDEFDTGAFKHSDSGAAHFADCRALFDLNAGVLITSVLCLAVLLIVKKRKRFGEFRLMNFSSAFWGAVSAVIIPIVVGCLAAIDFDKAFTVFHAVLFPGKDNWMLNWRTDEIILVMPKEFFRNCAILIGASVLIISGVVVIREIVRKSHLKKISLAV